MKRFLMKTSANWTHDTSQVICSPVRSKIMKMFRLLKYLSSRPNFLKLLAKTGKQKPTIESDLVSSLNMNIAGLITVGFCL